MEKPTMLTSAQMLELLATSGEGARRRSSSTDSGRLTKAFERLYEHELADWTQTLAARAVASYVWEWQGGSGGGGHMRGAWEAFSPTDQLSIETERRTGRPTADLTASTGERITIDFATQTATFRLSRKSVGVRSFAAMSGGIGGACNGSGGSGVPLVAKAEGGEAAAARRVECEICDGPPPVTVAGCGHSAACAGCLTSYVSARAESQPAQWPPCPSVGCDQPLGASVVAAAVGWPFLVVLLSKRLARLPEWAACTAEWASSPSTTLAACPGGVLVAKENKGSDRGTGASE
jgi:hypothetical protein